MKKNNPEQNFQANMEQQNLTLDSMRPSDELQVYYNDAYMREKQRFNDMFGLIDDDTPAPEAKKLFAESDQSDIDLSDYVSIKKFKRVKRTAIFFVVLTFVCSAAAALFALKYLSVF